MWAIVKVLYYASAFLNHIRRGHTNRGRRLREVYRLGYLCRHRGCRGRRCVHFLVCALLLCICYILHLLKSSLILSIRCVRCFQVCSEQVFDRPNCWTWLRRGVGIRFRRSSQLPVPNNSHSPRTAVTARNRLTRHTAWGRMKLWDKSVLELIITSKGSCRSRKKS